MLIVTHDSLQRSFASYETRYQTLEDSELFIGRGEEVISELMTSMRIICEA